MSQAASKDLRGRPLRNLRLSVTDRCLHLRCHYCMPEENYVWLEREHLLSFEEMTRLAKIFVGLGVDKVRLTGGEPLLRRDLHQLIHSLASIAGLDDLALTTNGVHLAEHAQNLAAAGLKRLTVSIDTLSAERFEALTRRRDFERVLEGIDAARSSGLGKNLKLDTVAIRGVNEDELIPLLEFAGEKEAELRFIEYMDVGGATRWDMSKVVSRDEILQTLNAHYGAIEELPRRDAAPADRYLLPDGRSFGIIASTTRPFCGSCDRSRLTADGHWFLCLYAASGFDLRPLLREGGSDDEIRERIQSAWTARSDQGAEERRTLRDREALADASEMRRNPHLEMHTRGG